MLNYDDGSALRATYIIDPDGVVRHASVTNVSVGRNPEETLRVLKAPDRRAVPGVVAAWRAHASDRRLIPRG